MSNYSKELKDLLTRANALQAKKERTAGRLEELLKQLKSDFDLSCLDEAYIKLESLHKDNESLESDCKELNADLDAKLSEAENSTNES